MPHFRFEYGKGATVSYSFMNSRSAGVVHPHLRAVALPVKPDTPLHQGGAGEPLSIVRFSGFWLIRSAARYPAILA